MKKLPAAKTGTIYVLGIAVLFCLLPFVIFPFFSSMSKDDYMLHYLYHRYGFAGTQHMVYSQWTGRYTSTFIGTLFMSLDIPGRYYFVHSLFLLMALWASLFFLSKTVNRYLLELSMSNGMLTLAAFVLLILSIYVQADIATGLYWFSSAVTYETATIFFILLVACLVRRGFDPGSREGVWWRELPVWLLILLICGSNEVAAVFLFFFLVALVCAHYYYRRTVSVRLIVYPVLALVAGLIILFTSGILAYRHNDMNPNTHYWVVLPMIAWRVLSVCYFVLKNPLVWVVGALLYVGGRRLAPGVLAGMLKGRKIVVPGLVGVLALVSLTLAVVLLASKGSLPDRALNNLTDCTMLYLLALSFLAGVAAREDPEYVGEVLGGQRIPSAAVGFVLAATLLANDQFFEAWKNVCCGYFYHAVIKDRAEKMQAAGEAHQKTVRLEPYDQVLAKKVRQVFPHGVFETVNHLLKDKPSFQFYDLDIDTPDPGWPYFYHLDTVLIVPEK